MTEILCRYCSDPVYHTVLGFWEDLYEGNYPRFCGANPHSTQHDPSNKVALIRTVIYFNGMPCTMTFVEGLPTSHRKANQL